MRSTLSTCVATAGLSRSVVACREGRPCDIEAGSRLVRTSWLSSPPRPDAAHRLQKTTLVVGSRGSGKTETLLRPTPGAAEGDEWSVFVIDAKGDLRTAARILNAAHTILLHSVPEREALTRAAGTRIEIEASVQHDQGRSLKLGSAREQHQHKVSSNAAPEGGHRSKKRDEPGESVRL